MSDTALERERKYAKTVSGMRDTYLDYPAAVAVETVTACNARCDFCAFPTSTRTGERMDPGLFDKLLDDLSEIPPDRRFQMNLSGTNEPLSDPHFYDRCRAVEARLPGARLVLYTNGSLLDGRGREALVLLGSLERISVSLNEFDKGEYRRLMQLDLGRTLANLDGLHGAVAGGRLSSEVYLTRVSNGGGGDDAFREACAQRFPLFRVRVRPKSPPFGAGDGRPGRASSIPCAQWFKLHILPNGRSKFCCADADGTAGEPVNLRHMSALAIYNLPSRRRLRERVAARGGVPECGGCERLV